ncbi:hypothetical protein [Roseococcus microcysteis]|uniref:hypothetical protein n=1 Tax=Roseococcus microcysteis TaxID=2771361 RepID=UPI00168BC74F|nr:hypothetical protein [Roseococcus microcysteis]
MRHLFRPALLALTLGGAFLSLAAPATAQSYPRVTGTGEDFMIDYGPMARGNVVGGGRVMVSQPSGGMDFTILHLDAIFSQQPRPGLVPLSIGTGEGIMVIYVPAMMIEQMRRALGAMAR